MQDPTEPSGPRLSPEPPKRQRQERTVYTKRQQAVLEESFEKNFYPTYETRVALAAELNLMEHQVQSLESANRVWRWRKGGRPAPPPAASPEPPGNLLPVPPPSQVWFKNRRAKRSRQQHQQQLPLLSGQQGAGRGVRTAPRCPGAVAPVSGVPVCPQGPGFWSSSGPSSSGLSSAAEAAVCSLHQAWGGPGCSAQQGVLTAQGPGVSGPIPGPATIPGPMSGSVSGPKPMSGPIPGPATIPGPMSGPGPATISTPMSGSVSGPRPMSGPIPGPATIPGPMSGLDLMSGPGPATISTPMSGSGSVSGPRPMSDPIPGPATIPNPYSSEFLPDMPSFSDFLEFSSSQDPFEGSSVSTTMSGYEEENDSVDRKHSGSR
ncbi:tetra-peptide repeat homeobox protein 1 [Carlito syrichta]|uniref:Tetra-peptide repeat homeobox protein 1 n=1 Tax=Carlito syrichta TaxID=1868482 RepID=A0A3Q0DJH4_CARSF|nr:tetra-peptide repeat homeobox protein 1 [Carlito syrichta]